MKLLRYGMTGVGLAVVGLFSTVQMRWDRTFEAPATNFKASTDLSVIERGRYLANGPAHCVDCHATPKENQPSADNTGRPLTGGLEFHLPIGTFRAPNITPDVETGIGRYSDEQLARMIRYGIRHDGQAGIPFMEFQNLSDEDVIALISFLRAQPAVNNYVPDHELKFLGMAIKAFVLKPGQPADTPPTTAPRGLSIETGEYLAYRVANCKGCHTKRSMMDGSYTGPEFAGGNPMVDDKDPTISYVPPNLTPDAKTGRIANWTEDQFVTRVRAGKQIRGSHMPWVAFGKMSEDDLRSIYRYLMSLEPVENETGPSIQPTRQ